MPNYESYRDVLSEHTARGSHVFGSSMLVILVAFVAAVAASVL